MYYLTKDLVHRPSSKQARWLADAVPLPAARDAWMSTLLLWCAVFFLMSLMGADSILSLMVAILALAAAATSLAPRTYQSICAHATLQLRARSTDRADEQDLRFRRVATGYFVACLGLLAIIASYNLLSFSILMAWSGHPLEMIFPQWDFLSTRLLFGGWPALVLGEYWLLQSLKS